MPVTERASRHDREPRPCAVHGLIHLARHTFATEHREVAGIDAASQPLGHADLLSTIRVYKDRDQTTSRRRWTVRRITTVSTRVPGRRRLEDRAE
jgi:integrase